MPRPAPDSSDSLEIPAFIRSRFPADQRAAVDFLRVLVDEGMLREIAEADYGQDAHMAVLLPIRGEGMLAPMDCRYPQEVLGMAGHMPAISA